MFLTQTTFGDLTCWPCWNRTFTAWTSPYTIRKLYKTTVSRLWTENAPDCDSWEMETKEVSSPIALALCLKAISEIQGQGASTQKEPGSLTKLRDNWHLGRLRQLELQGRVLERIYKEKEPQRCADNRYILYCIRINCNSALPRPPNIYTKWEVLSWIISRAHMGWETFKLWPARIESLGCQLGYSEMKLKEAHFGLKLNYLSLE